MTYKQDFANKINAAIDRGKYVLDADVNADIIKFHALIEHIINVILTLSIVGDPDKLLIQSPVFEKILERLSFDQKIIIIRDTKLVSKVTIKLLTWINDMRIVSAHPRIRKSTQYSTEKIHKLLDGLTEGLINNIDPEITKSRARADALASAINETPKNK